MEHHETPPQPSEINPEELSRFIDSILWEEGTTFTFNGIKFHLIITPKENLEQAKKEGKLHEYGKIGEFFQSANGYDIYLHGTIPEFERKRVLFHLIFAASFQHYQNLPEQKAYQQAREAEEKIFGPRPEGL